MARRDMNYMMDYEDTGGFGGDLFSDFYNGDNGFGAAPVPLIQPTPEPAAPQFDPVEALFASQPVAPEVDYYAQQFAPDVFAQPVAQPQPIVQPAIQPVVETAVQPTPQPIGVGLPALQPEAAPIGASLQPLDQAAAQDAQQNTGVFGLPSLAQQQATQQPQQVQPVQPTGPAPEVVNSLSQQILGQGLTSKWSGEGYGSAEKNAADMAKILAGIGITDIKQFGKVPVLEQAVVKQGYNGQPAQQDEDGNYFIVQPSGEYDSEGNQISTRVNVDPSKLEKTYGFYENVIGSENNETTFVPIDQSKVITKDGVPMVQTGETFGNKATGQAVPNTYSERQTGNFFGGTFAGKGNTGYGVQFDAQGNPIFYTQGASSNDVAKIMEMAGPVGQIAAAYFGGPAAVAAISAASGKPIGDIIKSAALSYMGGLAGNAVSGIEGITDVLGQTGTNIVSNAAKQFVGSGGKVDPVQALLAGGVNAGVNSLAGELGFDKLDPSTQKLVSTGITGLVAGKTPEQIAIDLAMAGLNTKPDNKLTSSLGPGDMDEFNASLIPGYFQPGGEGYIPPEETNPITVQQEPTDLDDFLKQLEQFKQVAVTPDDIQKIISNQNFATPEDIQTAINTIDIPKGLSEQDVQAIVSNAFAENPGIGMEDIQSVVDAAVSKIPAGVSQEDLTRSLGETEQNVMAQVGKQGEQFQTLFDQYRELGMDADAALRQTIDDLGTDVGSQLTDVKSQIADVQTGLGNQISQQSEQFQDLLQQYRDLGMDENDALRQTIDDLGSDIGGQLSDVKGQLSQQEEQFQTLLQQYRDLGMEESDALRQTIDDLGTDVGSQISDVQTKLGSQISEQSEQFQTLLQQYRDLGMEESDALRQTIDDLGSTVTGQLSEQSEQFQTLLQQYRDLGMEESDALRQTIDDLGSTFNEQLSGLESGLSGQLSEQNEQFQTLLQQYRDLGMDEDAAMRQTIDDLGYNLSEQITDVSEETKAALEKQSAETKAQLLNLAAAQKAQAAASSAASAAAAAKAQETSVAQAKANAIAQQNTQLAALLNMMGSNNDVANIKSYKELFGTDLFGPLSEAPAESAQSEEQLFRGGHINDISVDDLLQILRG